MIAQALKNLGVRLAIDDFRAGCSSLAYLKRFPVDTLKIDRSFIHRLGEDPDDTAMVRSVLALAGALGRCGYREPRPNETTRDDSVAIADRVSYSRVRSLRVSSGWRLAALTRVAQASRRLMCTQ